LDANLPGAQLGKYTAAKRNLLWVVF